MTSAHLATLLRRRGTVITVSVTCRQGPEQHNATLVATCCGIVLEKVLHAGQPDPAGVPVLMALHKQQAVESRSTSLSGSPSDPHSPPLSHQQANTPFGHSHQQFASPLGRPERQPAPDALQHTQQQQKQSQKQPQKQPQRQPQKQQQQQQAAHQSGEASQRSVMSPLDHRFPTLPETEKVKLLHKYLLANKPHLQPLEVPPTQELNFPEVRLNADTVLFTVCCNTPVLLFSGLRQELSVI